MSKSYGLKNGFRKDYQRGYQKGFDDGVKIGKSLFKPKLPEVNEKCEPEQLNDLIYRPERPKSCLNCDFYKKYLVGGQPFIGDAPCQCAKINRAKSILRLQQLQQLHHPK